MEIPKFGLRGRRDRQLNLQNLRPPPAVSAVATPCSTLPAGARQSGLVDHVSHFAPLCEKSVREMCQCSTLALGRKLTMRSVPSPRSSSHANSETLVPCLMRSSGPGHLEPAVVHVPPGTRVRERDTIVSDLDARVSATYSPCTERWSCSQRRIAWSNSSPFTRSGVPIVRL